MLEKLVPSHSRLSEQQVIGVMLRYPDSADTVLDSLTDADFYLDAHAIVFRAIVARIANKRPFDAALIYEDLMAAKQTADVGGAAYLAELWEGSGVPATLEYHCETIVDHATRRRVSHAAAELIGQLKDTQEPAAEILARFVDATYFSARSARKQEPIRITTAVSQCLQQIDERTRPGGAKPLTTGFERLNNVLGGFRPGEFILLGARPSVGKSALALSFLLAAAEAGTSSIVFSLEMSAAELASRALAITSEVPLNQITGSVRFEQDTGRRLVTGADKLNMPVWIDDRPEHTPTSIATVARRAVQKHGVGLVVIDYLQLIRHEGAKSDQQHTKVGNTSRALKLLARSLNVPVICLAQINRESEARNDGMPTLADFRESGSLEQDADVALLLWPLKVDAVNPPDEQEIRVIVAKQRNGPRCVAPLTYTRKYTRFGDGFNVM